MSSGINLTASTRASLLSLQNTAALQATTNQHLSTGKKVSSALDNPVNFFTAQGLDSRSSALTSLLDGMSNGIQTIQAANQGITSITSLINQMTSLVKTARQDSTGVTLGTASLGTNTATGNNKQATFTLADGSTVGIVLTDGSGNAKTSGDIVNEINGNATLSASVTASIDSVTGKVSLQNKTGTAISVAGLTGGNFDGSTGTTSLAAGTVALSSVRQNAANQFNSLLTQLNQVAKDSGYNGTNLLGGDVLKIVFNEKTGANASSATVQANNANGTPFGALTYSALGLGTASTTADGTSADWSSNTNLDGFTDKLTSALSTLQSQSAQFGSALALTQTRQDFTKNIINVLQTGSGNLTDADMNQEAANSQSLSTRNSLAVSALSLANTQAQSVLQLLR